MGQCSALAGRVKSPRLLSRGPIEAYGINEWGFYKFKSPRLLSRGPIEADDLPSLWWQFRVSATIKSRPH